MVIKKFLEKEVKQTLPENNDNKKLDIHYFKLPYIGKFSKSANKTINRMCGKFCKNLNIKLVFTPTKINMYFSTKDSLPKSHKSFVVYKFSCAGCNSSYIGETQRHLSTRIKEHLSSDKSSHIFKHLGENEACKSVCDENCFTVIDTASSPFRLKIKEAIHIGWEKPDLNRQVNHLVVSIPV